MGINVELLRKTLEHITAHPEEHDQANWACGTKMCLAGHAVYLAGYQLVWRSDPGSSLRHALDVTTGEEISNAARRELGLSQGQALMLFDARCPLGLLWELAHSYTDGEIEVPERFQSE